MATVAGPAAVVGDDPVPDTRWCGDITYIATVDGWVIWQR